MSYHIRDNNRYPRRLGRGDRQGFEPKSGKSTSDLPCSIERPELGWGSPPRNHEIRLSQTPPPSDQSTYLISSKAASGSPFCGYTQRLHQLWPWDSGVRAMEETGRLHGAYICGAGAPRTPYRCCHTQRTDRSPNPVGRIFVTLCPPRPTEEEGVR